MHGAPDCIAAIGSTGMGKGLYVTELIRARLAERRRPLLIWSLLEETDCYGEKFSAPVVRSIPVMAAQLKARAGAVVFWPLENPKLMAGQFALFCQLGWLTVDAVVLVEELSQVTTPSYAPPAWKKLSTAGRHRRLTVIGASQRPAHMDKDFFGNCTEIRAYRVGYADDAKALASVFSGEWEIFMRLEDRHYLHLWKSPRRIEPGVQALPGEGATNAQATRSGAGQGGVSRTSAAGVAPARSQRAAPGVTQGRVTRRRK